MISTEEQGLVEAIQRLDLRAGGIAEERYREAAGHAAPTIGSSKVTKRQQALYDGFLAEEREKRRPEKERLEGKLRRLRALPRARRPKRKPAKRPVAAVLAPCHQGAMAQMTSEEFNAILDELGWKQADLARRLSEASDKPIRRTTVNRWAKGTAGIHPGLAIYLRLALQVHRSQLQI